MILGQVESKHLSLPLSFDDINVLYFSHKILFAARISTIRRMHSLSVFYSHSLKIGFRSLLEEYLKQKINIRR